MTPKVYKLFLFLLIVHALFACHQERKKISIETNFDESNFVRTSNVMDRDGNISTTFYANKSDSNFIMVKTWWDDSTVQSCSFFRKGVKFGPRRLYGLDGKLENEGFFLNNKLNGLSLYYDAGKLISIEVYVDGQKKPIDSNQEKSIVAYLLK